MKDVGLSRNVSGRESFSSPQGLANAGTPLACVFNALVANPSKLQSLPPAEQDKRLQQLGAALSNQPLNLSTLSTTSGAALSACMSRLKAAASTLAIQDWSAAIQTYMVRPGAKPALDTRVVTADQIDFTKGASVVSSAQKFILPVPQFTKGEALVYPPGTKDKDGKDLSGQPIVDWKGNPIGDQGVVFFNHKDKSWQAVKCDGEGVIIMNQVSEDQARSLQAKIGPDPSRLTLKQFKQVLEDAAELGLGDRYNSDRAFIQSKMNVMERSATGIAQYGLHRRDDRDVCSAVFISGAGEFQGPAATPQKFSNGAVILKQGDSIRLIQPDAFAQTYTNKDGSPMDVRKLPRQELQAGLVA